MHCNQNSSAKRRDGNKGTEQPAPGPARQPHAHMTCTPTRLSTKAYCYIRGPSVQVAASTCDARQ
jgi:hypothetical protein